MVASFVSVWDALATFLVSLFPELTELFYADGDLTFVGVMAVVMAGVAMVLLVFNIIRSFLPMRG